MEHCGLVRLVVSDRVHWVGSVRSWATAHVIEVVVVAWSLNTGSASCWKIILVVGEIELILTNLSLQGAPHLLLLGYLSFWRALLLGWAPLARLLWLFFGALEGFLSLRGRFLLCRSQSFWGMREMLWGWSHIHLLKENIGGGSCNGVRSSADQG